MMTYSTSLEEVADIATALDFEVAIDDTVAPAHEALKRVSAWTSIYFYNEASDDPIGSIVQDFDPNQLAFWVDNIDHASVNVWLNRTVTKREQFRIDVAALHELELHVLPFFRLYRTLREAKRARGAGQIQQASAMLGELIGTARIGRFKALQQHGSVELRVNQVLATFMLVCDELRKAGSTEFDPDRDEHAVLAALRHDVIGDTDSDEQGNTVVKLADVKAAYVPKLPLLNAVYTKAVVDAVVDEFETD
jgi:hypothetical protein